MGYSLRDDMRNANYELELRVDALQANSMFRLGTVAAGGGDRHLIRTHKGIITSQSLGGTVAVGDTALIRQDSGESVFY